MSFKILESYNLLRFAEAKELLQKWREENVRCPEKVREIWCDLNLGDYLDDESKCKRVLFII